MSAKLFRPGESPDVPSYETILATAKFGPKTLRRRTVASLLEEQQVQAAVEEWESWKKASPFSGKANH